MRRRTASIRFLRAEIATRAKTRCHAAALTPRTFTLSPSRTQPPTRSGPVADPVRDAVADSIARRAW